MEWRFGGRRGFGPNELDVRSMFFHMSLNLREDVVRILPFDETSVVLDESLARKHRFYSGSAIAAVEPVNSQCRMKHDSIGY